MNRASILRLSTLALAVCGASGCGGGGGGAAAPVSVIPRFAYVANINSDNVTTFAINPVTGALTEIGTEVAAGDGANAIVILGGPP